jgi:hypothetical protein
VDDADADAVTGVISNEPVAILVDEDDAVDDAEASSCAVTDAVATDELIFCETDADAISGEVTDLREVLDAAPSSLADRLSQMGGRSG